MVDNVMETKYSSCYFCSSRGCGVKVRLENGCIERVTVDTKAPVVPGAHCPRPALARDYQESPFRLNYPLKRKGERGEDSWERISWDEALDYTASRLKAIKEAHGSDSIAFLASAKVTNEENYIIMKFARAAVGTNNVDHCARL